MKKNFDWADGRLLRRPICLISSYRSWEFFYKNNTIHEYTNTKTAKSSQKDKESEESSSLSLLNLIY